MHIAMGTSADPVGVLTRLEKPIFEGGVGECLRIREDDSRVGRPALGASGDDCVARTPGCSLENGGMASGGGEACEEGNKGGPGAEEGAEEGGEEGAGLAPVVFCAPADVSLIAKDSNKLTIQWGKSRRLEGPDPAGLAVRYTVETQQVDVPSGRETPNGEEAAALVNSDLWRAAAQTADSWAQIRGLRPGRYYAIRVAAAPRCDEPCLRLWAPEASAVAVFHTTPSAPGAPQPPQLTSRERTSLKFKWNVPESGGLNIIDFRLQLRPPPATAKDDVDEEGFAEIFCGLQQSFRATKLLPGVKYTARVKARNELGEGPWSLHSVFTTEASVPAMPEPPRQVHVSSASVSLQWDAPKDNGARIDLYTLEAWNEEDDCFRPVYCGQSPQCAISDLESGATYRFKVRAENQAGKSKWSGTTIVHIAPSAPGPPHMLSCQSSTKTSASFSWAPPRYTGGSEISCYEGEVMPLSRPAGKSTWTTVYSGQAHSCSVGSLTPGCTYQIRVRASNAAGWGPKSQCTKFTSEPGVPDKVPVPTVVSLGSTSLKVSWKAPAHDGGSNITGYQLQCCEARKVASDSASVFKGVYYGSLCSWEAGGLLPGKEYAFRVQAVNACGASSWSTVTKGTTKAGVPDIPTPPTVRESSSDSLTLCWIPPDGRGSTVSSYTVQLAQEGGRCNGFVSHEEHRKACAGSTEGMGSGNEAEPLLDHGAGVSAGGMCSSCDGGALDFSDVYTGSQVQCRVPGLHAGTTYRVRLRASNKAGSSQWSKAVAFKTQAAAPSSPRNLQATEVSTNSVHLCWEHPLCDNGSKVCMYALERLSQRSKKVAWVQEYQGQATSTSYTVAPLRNGCEYQFRVRAVNGCGAGPPSETLMVETAAAPPGAPEGPTFAQRTPTSVRVKWAPPDRENGAPVKQYRLEAAEAGGAFREVYSGYSAYHKVTGLAAGQQYLLRVRAVNAAGAGPWSEAMPVVMALAPPTPPTNLSVTSSMDNDGAIHGEGTALDIAWEHDDRASTPAATFEVEVCPSKGRGGQLRTSAVRRVVAERSCRVGSLPSETSFVVRVRAVGAKPSAHSKWAEAYSLTTPGLKRLRAPSPSESGSSGTTTVTSSSRSSKSTVSDLSDDSMASCARSSARSLPVKKGQLRLRPRPRKSVWKAVKTSVVTMVMVAVAVAALFVVSLNGGLG